MAFEYLQQVIQGRGTLLDKELAAFRTFVLMYMAFDLAAPAILKSKDEQKAEELVKLAQARNQNADAIFDIWRPEWKN